MQIVNLILTLISLALKWTNAKDEKKKELNDELETAISSRNLSQLNSLIDKL